MTEEKIILGEKANQEVKCSNCKRDFMASEAYRFKSGKTELFICTSCRETINKQYETELENPNLVGGLLAGLGAGLLGGLAWYLFVVITKFQIAYLAIGIGYLVAMGVQRGSGNKRGISLQFIALGTTLFTLFVAHYFVYSQLVLQASAKASGVESGGLLSGKLVEAAILLLDRLDLFVNYVLSPISLLIWAIASYVSFSYLRPRKI